MIRFHLLGLTLCLCAPVQGEVNENWPRFRGPTAMGVAKDDPRLPDTWDQTKHVLWQTKIPGWGWSSPVVWGDRVFLTTVVNDEAYEKPKRGLYLGEGRSAPPGGTHHWFVYCVSLKSGKVVWKHEAHQGKAKSGRHPKSTFASETPATDGERVYVLFGDLGLYCYTVDGKPLWSHPIAPKKTFRDYGAAASPVVHEDQVIMVYDNEEESYIASFDTKTGTPKWRTPRKEETTWSTPFVWTNALRTEIVTPGKLRNRSYDLNGKVLWEMDGRMSHLVIPSPFASFGMVYITSGFYADKHRPVFAIKPGASGDITLKEGETANEFISWYQPKAGPYNTSPIVYGDYYYTLYDKGFLTCHNARTGKEVYGKTRISAGATFTSSPWAYNGKLFCLSEDGDTYVLEAGPKFRVVGTNRLDALCLASPAISQGNLLVRTASQLFCLRRP